MKVIFCCVCVILIYVTKAQSSGLLPGGTNVEKKYETYYAREATTRRIIKSTQTCRWTCTWIIFCKTVCSTKYYNTWETIYKNVTKTRPIYQCKAGWRQDGNECTLPICGNGCSNNGICIAPDACNCTAQWNGTTCSQDVDECDPSSGIHHGCQHKCHNYPGGYNCTCPPGHFLTTNGKNCSDHDECAGNIHGCQQGCDNYPGGYTCTCRPGYALNINDNKTCNGHECEAIHSPLRGGMACTGYTTDHSCNFTCDPGYELRGSNQRSCSASGKWTGDETSCKIIHCPTPSVPRHGFVYTPCHTPFRSKCIVGCKRGYFMAGDGVITCNSSGVWQPPNLSCQKQAACEQNLCRHNSICTPLSSSRYICDCSKSGYRGINCHVGYITTPKYPRITAGVPSSPLEFRSSPLTSSGHVILTPSSRDVTFTPSSLLFNSTSSRQSLTVTSVKPGIYLVKYSISGANAAEFFPPENDVIFVEVMKNSTNQTTGNSTTNLVLPIGCHQMHLRKCPTGDDVMVSSTAPWETIGNVTSSSGVIVMHAGKTNIPLSLLGTSLPSNLRSTDEKKCNASQNYSVEQLIENQVLTKSYLDALKDRFPKWLSLKLRREINRNSFHISDINTLFLSGKELRQTLTGKGQPIADDSSFSLLHSPNINVTFESDDDILKSRDEKSRISLAVDLCSETPKTVILRAPDKYANLIQNSSVFKRLKQNGWELTISSLQISKTNSIKTPRVKERFWDGERLISSNFDMKRNLALVAKVKKSFVGKNLSSYLEFDGTTIISVGNLDSILRSPLDQVWLVDLYGNMKLTTQLTIEGEKANLTFNGAESVSFAKFGANPVGQADRKIHEGLYISHTFETSPFVNSGLAKFIEVSSKDGIEAFFKTTLNSAKNKTGQDQIEAVNMAFHGALKFGQLRYEDVGMIFKTLSNETGKSDSIKLTGRARINTTRNYGIFKPSNLNVHVYISRQDSRESVGLFESSVEVLGFRNVVNVSFGLGGLSFNTTGLVHGLFEADVNSSSPLMSWQNQRFVASGQFKSGKGSLVDTLGSTLRDYASKVYDRAQKRVAFFEGRERRAKKRFESVLSVLEMKKQELSKSQVEYNISKRNLEAAEVRFNALQGNVSQSLDKLKKRLNAFCPEVKQCPDICQAGVVCRHCKYEIAGKSKTTCLSTCYKTETRRVQTNASSVPCTKQQCVRVYVKNGLAKRTLEQNLIKLQNDIFSFGKKASGRRQSLQGLSKGEEAELFPGTRKQDVCQYAETSSNAIVEKLCVTDDRNGHWDCNIRTENCTTSGFRYESYHSPYTCEQPCETHVTTEEISKSCCETLPCAIKTVNRTCVAENHFCNNLRTDALEKLAAANTSGEIRLLKDVEIAKGNLCYWRIQARNAEIRLKSAITLLNLTQDTAKSLREAYNASVTSKEKLSKSLSEKLNLKWIFDPKMRGIEFRSASFRVDIQEGGNYLVPVKFGLEVNGTTQEFDSIVNFKAMNSSLSSIAENVLDLYCKVGAESDNKRNRSFIENEEYAYGLSSLRKYHKLCAEFTNYEQALHDMTMSLFNLTSEAKGMIKNAMERNATDTFNASKVLEHFNSSQAKVFGLEIDKESYLTSLQNDPIMLAAHELQNEALEDGYKPLYLNSKLLFRNWFSAMESIFHVLSVNGTRNCRGFEDCIVFLTDGLFEMNEASGLPESHKVRVMIGHLRTELGRLSVNTNLTLNEANEISRTILSVLKDMREIKLLCARAPNITKQPDSFMDVGEGRPLMLTCNATGDLLSYIWKLNDDYLTDQTTNILYINKVTSSHSANYTCVVTNYISMKTSAPAVVIVHLAPRITIQPITRLNAIVYANDSLRCIAESTDNNLTYQWYFKAKNSSVFKKLISQKFSYLNFVPVKSQHEGWYYCNVSNFYGAIRSTTSYVKVLSFDLPVPFAKMSVTLRQSRNNARLFKRSETNSIGYEDIKSKLAELLLLNVTFNGTSNNSTTNLKMELSPQVTQCSTITASKFCRWIFQYVSKNVSSNGENFEQNAKNVIGALQELRETIGRLVQAVNDGALAFDLGDQRFLVEKNSVGVEDVSSLCTPGKRLEQNFKCVDCPPGYYGMIDDNAIATCVPCRVGSYQPNSGQTVCTQCPDGFTTAQKGAIEKLQCQVICPAGMYGQIRENVGRCLNCSVNTYQPESGQFGCILCPDDYITATEGAKDISECYPEPTTTRRPTERQTTSGEPTEHHRTTETPSGEPTEHNRTTETPQRTTPQRTTPQRTAPPTSLTTGEDFHSPAPGALNADDDSSKTPVIGGAVGAFLFLLLLALALLYLVQRRRIAMKSHEPLDDRNVIVSGNGMELNSWHNPGFDEDDAVHNENPLYIAGSTSPVASKNPVYEASVDFREINLDTDTEAADLKVHGSYENGHVASHFGNPLYESNPSQDKINVSTPLESTEMSSNDISHFGNPLYEAFQGEQALKNATLKLNDDVVTDEDV